MSGGSYNYIGSTLKMKCAGRMYDAEMNGLIVNLCEVLHDLEWWQSCDSSEEVYRETVAKFKEKWFNKGYKEPSESADTVKLIIEIPKPMYENVQNGTYCGTLYKELKNGMPLDSNSELAEVEAYFAGQIYGWEQGRKALIDDAKAKITALRYGSDTYKHAIDDVIEILDNIGKGE